MFSQVELVHPTFLDKVNIIAENKVTKGKNFRYKNSDDVIQAGLNLIQLVCTCKITTSKL